MMETDNLILAQTIILGITAVIVLWYTYETYQIRKMTDIQYTLTSELALKSLPADLKNNLRQLSFIDLVFVNFPVESSFDRNGGKWVFTNKGGPVTDLKAHAVGNKHKVTVSPTKKVSKYGKLELVISDIPSSDDEAFAVHFEIHYANKLGFKAVQGYRYFPNAWRVLSSNNRQFELMYTSY